MREKAFNFIDSKREEMTSLWETLVNMDSGVSDKEDVDKVARFLAGIINGYGGCAEILEFAGAGNGLKASFGKPAGKAPICFLGHYDTVFPRGEATKRPFRVEGGKAYGPGVLDMKGGVVIQIFVAAALREAGYSDRLIKTLLAGDEERGHPNSSMGDVMEQECKGALAAFNFETGDTDNSLVVGRKGTGAFTITVKGVSVHAGREPENGRSAILEIAHKVVEIQNLNDYEKGITYNVGLIKGGVAPNAVPDHAEIVVDLRVCETEQFAEAAEKINEIVSRAHVEGTSATCVGEIDIPPMPRTALNEKLFEYVRKTSLGLGLPEPKPTVSGGGSDSAYSVKAGLPTIDQMGVKGRWNHSDREYAVAESLFERAKLAIACVLGIDEFEKSLGR